MSRSAHAQIRPSWIREITFMRVTGTLVLLIALGAAGDLLIIMAGAFIATVNSDSVIVSLATILANFSFYPMTAVAAVCLLIGALIVIRNRDGRRIGIALVATGIASAAFVALTFLPQTAH
jgi:hypothetical protein